MGYSAGLVYHTDTNSQTRTNEVILVHSVQCDGSETRMLECEYKLGETHCNQPAEVLCLMEPITHEPS